MILSDRMLEVDRLRMQPGENVMKKNEELMKRNEALFEDDEENENDDWFIDDEDGIQAIDALEAMTDFMKAQNQSALSLTKLTLEYCKIENMTKDKVFAIFQDAINLVKKNVQLPNM